MDKPGLVLGEVVVMVSSLSLATVAGPIGKLFKRSPTLGQRDEEHEKKEEIRDPAEDGDDCFAGSGFGKKKTRYQSHDESKRPDGYSQDQWIKGRSSRAISLSNRFSPKCPGCHN